MKKKTFFKALEWLKDTGLKAFAVLALIVGGFYVYAELVVWPTNDPNPTTGVVGVFVGESKAPFNPSSASPAVGTNYIDANNLCATHTDENIKGSHVCTPDEMVNSYNHSNAQSPILTYKDQAGASKTLWINNGPPAFTANANDCKGWAAVDSPLENMNYGTVWNFDDKAGGLLPCNVKDKKFACCK